MRKQSERKKPKGEILIEERPHRWPPSLAPLRFAPPVAVFRFPIGLGFSDRAATLINFSIA